MSLSALPVQELWDRIIDCLHDSPCSLRACALACRAFTSRAQSLIFHTIHAPVDPIDCGAFEVERIDELKARLKRFRTLSSVLLTSPNTGFLISRVQRLDIHTSSPQVIAALAGVPWSNVLTLRLKNIPHLSDIVKPVQDLVAIPSLQHLELRFAPTVYGGYLLTPSSFSTILRAVREELSSLSLGLCNPYPFSPSSTLNRDLPTVSWQGNGHARIRTLQLDHSPGIIPLLFALSSGPAPVLDLSYVNTLHLQRSWNPVLHELLQRCGQKVETLHLDAFDDKITTLSFDHFPNLCEVICPNAADWTPSSQLFRGLPKHVLVRK
ncbi:hypothetical protein MIND_01351100 [Mycena indigotica]|uniref:F-box domain-containing protein n=1 Tax=Mycena indigotica TaxID=2126181 RepID=A0A8H6VPY4_9AGAR|nr:uncharacterized protein MIND_01351100 [Mycena indigotica]KAF7289772.1 hypothetical protein MIND_01351100 [Mycena indigotica]